MGLIIKQKNEKRIFVQGLSYNPSECYCRLDFKCDSSGRKMQVNLTFYESKQQWEQGSPLALFFEENGVQRLLNSADVTITVDEKQSVDTAHSYVAQAFIDLGYDCITDLV